MFGGHSQNLSKSLEISRNFSRFVWRPLSKSLEIFRNLSTRPPDPWPLLRLKVFHGAWHGLPHTFFRGAWHSLTGLPQVFLRWAWLTSPDFRRTSQGCFLVADLDMTSLNDWTVIDIHWPTSHLASSNLQFLKDKGCCTMEADLFGVDWHSIAEGKQTKAITFVLSNLNWRQRNFEVISSYGWQDRSKQALYGLVIRFLRAQVLRCHIIIVCRCKDGIHEHHRHSHDNPGR